MPSISVGWPTSWENPWGPPLVLDGLVYNAGSITYLGDMGLFAAASEHYDPYGVLVPAQSWQDGFNATSASVTFTRAGGVGSHIELKVMDAGNNQIGYVAPTVYPAGQTTVVIALSAAGYDLASFALNNTDYPTLGVDVTVLDLFASQGAVNRQWTNYLGCGES